MYAFRAALRCVLLTALLATPVGLSWAAVVGGTLDGVSAAQRTIAVRIGTGDKTQSFRLSADLKITLDGKPAALADLKAGQRVSLYTTDDEATRIVARGESNFCDAIHRVRQADGSTPQARCQANPSAAAATAANSHPWPQFRGPNRDNISLETGLLKSWPSEGPKLLWTAKGLGDGYSSVSVAGGLVLTMGNQGNREAVLAVELQTGKPMWMTPTGTAYHEGRGDGPRSVPTVDGSLVYALGANGDLACLELAGGKLRWQVNLLSQFGSRNLTWGICESILIDGDQLICTPVVRGATMVALNKTTGKMIWSCNAPSGERAGYASPIVATVGGVRQYIQFTSEGTIGVRAQDGAPMWKESSAANSTANCSAPVFYKDCVFSASGYGTGGAMVRLASQRGMTGAELAYTTKEMKNHHGGMIVLDGYLYGSNDPGTLTCLEFMTGKVMWQSRSVGKGSLTYADGCLYLRSENGPMALVQATPDEYKELARFDPPSRSDSPAWSYPVVADGKLFLRDMDTLVCFEVKN